MSKKEQRVVKTSKQRHIRDIILKQLEKEEERLKKFAAQIAFERKLSF